MESYIDKDARIVPRLAEKEPFPIGSLKELCRLTVRELKLSHLILPR